MLIFGVRNTQCLQVGSDRWGYANPAEKLKRLRIPKIDVFPLTLEEIRLILDTVRPAFRNYYAVRFFTGMRTGEVDGLQWRYVDFDRRLILVRETLVRGQVEYTKTDGSQRDIQMSSPVYEALHAQREITGEGRFVFCTDTGAPLNDNNVTKRIWYPILRHLSEWTGDVKISGNANAPNVAGVLNPVPGNFSLMGK